MIACALRPELASSAAQQSRWNTATSIRSMTAHSSPSVTERFVAVAVARVLGPADGEGSGREHAGGEALGGLDGHGEDQARLSCRVSARLGQWQCIGAVSRPRLLGVDEDLR